MTPRPPHVVVLATLGRLGGAERSLVELVRRVGGAVRFTIVVPEAGPLAAAAVAAGAACRVLPWPAALAGVGERAGGLRRLPSAAVALRSLATALAREVGGLAPDVVVTNGIKAHALGRSEERRVGKECRL